MSRLALAGTVALAVMLVAAQETTLGAAPPLDQVSSVPARGGGKPKPSPPPPPSSPPARFWHAFTSSGGAGGGGPVCKAGGDRLYLFGGADLTSTYFDDLWYYCDGEGWLPAPTGKARPSARGHVAWSCSGSQCVAANGVVGPGYSSETWLYDISGQAWTKLNCRRKPCPSARWGGTMAFDPLRGYHVLFGGESGRAGLADTLTFDGTGWTYREPTHAVPPRRAAAAAFVPGPPGIPIDRVVLFGGQEVNVRSLCDMYSWSGSDWDTVVQENSGPCLNSHSMAWVADADGSGEPGLIVSGGFTDSSCDSPSTDVWYFRFTSPDSGFWVLGNPLSCDSPPADRDAVMTLDGSSQKKVFFGGSEWDSDAQAWTASDRTLICQ